MARLELWPAPTSLARARWTRDSRLVASDGVLTVHHGRRATRFTVDGCLMRPAAPDRDGGLSFPYVLVSPSGRVVCAIDLTEWVAGGRRVADRRIGRDLGPSYVEVRDALAEATGASVSSTPWDGALPRLASAVDSTGLAVHRGLLLVLAVLVAVPLVGLISPFTAVVGGAAAIGLVLGGTGPTRRWRPRRPMTWTVSTGHLRDAVSLDGEHDLLWVVDTGSRRAGAVPIGDAAHQVDQVDVGADTMRLLVSGDPAVDLTRAAWGTGGFELLREHLAGTPGLRVRDKTFDRRAVHAWNRLGGAYRPGLVGANMFFAVAWGLVAWLMSHVLVVAGCLWGAAAVLALVLAVEALVARRPGRSGTTP